MNIINKASVWLVPIVVVLVVAVSVTHLLPAASLANWLAVTLPPPSHTASAAAAG